MATGEAWTKEELRAAVVSHLETIQLFRTGVSIVKRHYYRDLAAKFGRTDKAFEYRAQNISYVLALQGRP
jgi:5-methylcytosine-specific restriction protein A